MSPDYQSEFMKRMFSEHGVDPQWTAAMDAYMAALRAGRVFCGIPRPPSPFLGISMMQIAEMAKGQGARGWAARPWQPGDPIYNPTSAGRAPSDRTVGRRFWQNEAKNPSRRDYTADDIARMKRALPPQRKNPKTGRMESMEMSHEPIPRRDQGPDMVPRWPNEHADLDPYRRLGH
jgi:hypothetical protein